MRRIVAVLCAFVFLGITAQAAPGDTTWVQAHNDVWMTYYGNFDTTVQFPDGGTSYRRIQMTFTLGKYQCPGSPQYCGDWDYTVHIYLMTKTGDTLELGRLITPYANATYPRTPWTWKQRYTYDVTDLYNQLKDSATVRILYSGYSGGFTANINFAMIEGTRPRDVLGVDRLWKGGFSYGTKNPIDNKVVAKSLTAPANTQSTEMKFTISGHGSDNAGCAEFCKKYYTVMLNANQLYKVDIWRDNCGLNNLYPQSGTWIYDRGNWCPGAIVYPNRHILTGVSAGSGYDIDVDFEAASDTSGASYAIEAMNIYYGGFNKNLDAAMEDIVAPSNHEMYFRYNPVTGRPIVIVRNEGATTITKVKFKYEIPNGHGPVEYEWQGSLASLDTAWVEFPPYYDLAQIPLGTGTFNVEILQVNGTADDDATNNKLSSTFQTAKKWPKQLRIELKTNAGVVNGVGETSWKIVDMFNNIVAAQRTNTAPGTLYTDTVNLGVGMYKLVVEDLGCDGLTWPWNSAGTGTLYVKGITSSIPFPQTGYFSGNFGCGYTEYFNTEWPASVTEVNTTSPIMSVYPNPARATISISLEGLSQPGGKMLLKDMTGRTIAVTDVTAAVTNMDVSAYANGVYTVVYIADGNSTEKLQSRVIIAR